VKFRHRLVALLAPGFLAAGCAAGADKGPAAPVGPETGLATVALDQRGEIGGVAVTPLRIEEDSRCPSGVQCIQAGTVRVAVRIEQGGGQREAVLTLAEPLRLADGRELTLAAVCPYPRHPGRIGAASYRFTFAFDRDGTSAARGLACAS
jgi:hypothetical protein